MAAFSDTAFDSVDAFDTESFDFDSIDSEGAGVCGTPYLRPRLEAVPYLEPRLEATPYFEEC